MEDNLVYIEHIQIKDKLKIFDNCWIFFDYIDSVRNIFDHFGLGCAIFDHIGLLMTILDH